MYYNGGLQFCAVSGSNGTWQLDKRTEHTKINNFVHLAGI